jgi:hypothetical protein
MVGVDTRNVSVDQAIRSGSLDDIGFCCHQQTEGRNTVAHKSGVWRCLKPEIKSSDATAPYDTYDSILEIPKGSDPSQNAWLTLQLRVKLNFVDSTNPVPGLTVNQGGKFYAKDTDGYNFPLMNWPAHLMARFQREYIQVAERTWNWQFLLITPRNCSDLDYCPRGSALTIRPNVLCLFRMSLLGPNGALDTSPAAGPMPSGSPHRTINVVNLSLATRQVHLDSSVTPTAAKPATKTINRVDGLAWRSNSDNYDDSDLFAPSWWNKEHKVLSNTVGHEVGHALGQCHIMGLKGIAAYTFTGANANDTAAYGVGSNDPLDVNNVMGGGDRLYLINAVSWGERIALHTGIAANKWQATGLMDTPPRRMPAGLTNTATEW